MNSSYTNPDLSPLAIETGTDDLSVKDGVDLGSTMKPGAASTAVDEEKKDENEEKEGEEKDKEGAEGVAVSEGGAGDAGSTPPNKAADKIAAAPSLPLPRTLSTQDVSTTIYIHICISLSCILCLKEAS